MLTYQLDPNGKIVRTIVNTMGLPQSRIEYDNAGSYTFTTSYDADGNITDLWEPGAYRNRDLDELGRILLETGSDPRIRYFSYDADQRTRMAYAPGGSYLYKYDDRGLLLESRNVATHVAYNYDDAGRLLTRAEKADGQTLTHNYTWTNQNELATHVDPVATSTATFTWNHTSQLTRIDQANSNRTFTYNSVGDLETDVFKRGTTTRAHSVFTYDDRGNVINEYRYLYHPGTSGRSHTYAYDRGNRLESWTVVQANNGAVLDAETYTYDKAGNRTGRVQNGTSHTWVYDERNRVISGPGVTYTWTDRGTLDYSTVNGVVHDTYFDSFGHMSGTKVGSGPWNYYFYDGYDRIWRRYIASSPVERQFWRYDGFNQDPFRTNGESGVITYGRSPTGQLRSTNDQRDGNSRPRMAGLNRHGDLAWLANKAGNSLSETISWSPYGEANEHWGNDPDPEYGYQTQYTDPTTGDVLAQSRWYSPGTGTFRSRDTWAGDLNTPVSLNRYTYGQNNPIRYWDPSGRCVESISVNADGTVHVVPMRGPECNPLDASGGAGLEGTKVREEYGPGAGAYDYQPTRGEPIPISGATWGTAGCTVGAFWCGLAERSSEAVTVLPATVEAIAADPWEFTKGIATLAAACSNPITCGAYTSNQYASDISSKVDEHGWGYAAGAVTFDVLTLAGSVATTTTRTGLRAGLRSANYCSFSGETGVLMADGTIKPISLVQIGDMVMAFDPDTGEHGERKVTHLWEHQDTLVDLDIADSTVTTTEDHPFWNQTDSEWQRADQLDSGDYVLTADGALLKVDGINPASQYSGTAHNLTVNDIHTYYVQVGDEQVLVHNTCPVQAYDVAPHKVLKANSPSGDGLDLHHAPQHHAANQILSGHTYDTGPAIALPAGEHKLIPNLRGPAGVAWDLTPRQLLARDVWNLRNLTNAPNAAIQRLVELSKNTYPGDFS